MKRLLGKRVGALMLASVLGVTGMFGYERFVKPNVVYAAGEENAEDEFEIITFAEGEGTGKPFSQNSWRFSGQYASPGGDYDVLEITEEGVKPGIYANEYSDANESVIRLINGVRSQKDGEGKNTGLEEENLFTPWWGDWQPDTDKNKSVQWARSGKAMLNVGEGEQSEPIKLDEHQSFALKFTVSMPEAVIQYEGGCNCGIRRRWHCICYDFFT